MKDKVFFIGAGPGDPDLITVKGKSILEQADVILYTGSLVPKEVLTWAKNDCLIQSSENMTYHEIFQFYKENIKNNIFVRLHTGDPSIYSTIAKQIEYLNTQNIQFEIIPGVTSAFAAAASLGIELTIPGVSQTIILSRVPGRTPNPEPLENILNCKSSSHIFYLSVKLIHILKKTAINNCGYSLNTPCWVVEKATWQEERVIKGTLDDIILKVKEANIRGNALIYLGYFLHQKEEFVSHLYNNNPYVWKKLSKQETSNE